MKDTPLLNKALGQADPNNALVAKNKKIKNATKVQQDGLTFDSKLELYMYNCLKEASIRFNYQVKYVLSEGFKYRNESYQPITLTVDFELRELDCIIDAKGFMNDISPMKYKMLKKHLVEVGREPRIVMPNSQKQCRELIQSLKSGFFFLDEKKKLSDNAKNIRRKKLKNNGWLLTSDNLWHKIGFIYIDDILMNLQKYDFEQLLK